MHQTELEEDWESAGLCNIWIVCVWEILLPSDWLTEQMRGLGTTAYIVEAFVLGGAGQ